MSPDDSQHRCTILIVDDDRDVQEMLRTALVADGYAVAAVDSGREALDYLRSHADACAMLLDLLLPSMDGEQFRHVQMRDRSLGWIPIVVMSAAVDAKARAAGMHADAFLKKPIDLDALRDALLLVTRNNCRRSRRR